MRIFSIQQGYSASLQFLLALLVAGNALSCAQPSLAKEGEKGQHSIFSEIIDGKSDWKLLTNERYGFSLRVPASSRVNGHRVSDDSEYIRIQNYQSSDSYGLKTDAYWLEIFIFDHNFKKQIWKPCSEMVIQHSVKLRDGVKIYQGEPSNVSPDTGGYAWALCAVGGNFDIYIQAAEANKDTRLLKKIYASFNKKRK